MERYWNFKTTSKSNVNDSEETMTYYFRFDNETQSIELIVEYQNIKTEGFRNHLEIIINDQLDMINQFHRHTDKNAKEYKPFKVLTNKEINEIKEFPSKYPSFDFVIKPNMEKYGTVIYLDSKVYTHPLYNN